MRVLKINLQQFVQMVNLIAGTRLSLVKAVLCAANTESFLVFVA